MGRLPYRSPEELDHYINVLSRLPFPVIDDILNVHEGVLRGRPVEYNYYRQVHRLSEKERLRILGKTSI